jgi:hypothetical protein
MKKPTPKTKDDRLSEALRANLRRRKQQKEVAVETLENEDRQKL